MALEKNRLPKLTKTPEIVNFGSFDSQIFSGQGAFSRWAARSPAARAAVSLVVFHEASDV